jgi:hypothetical protein
MIGKAIAYVALAVSDVEAVATTLSRPLGLPRTDCPVDGTARRVPVFGVGASALALFAADDPFIGAPGKAGVHHIALQVSDLADAARVARSAGIAVVDADPRPGLAGARRLALDPAATVGVRTHLSEPLAIDRHSAGEVDRIDHIGVASRDNRSALGVFVDGLGGALESTQTDIEVHVAIESFTSDTYGAVYHTRPPEPVGGLRVAFVTVGDCELEFLEDFDPRHGAWVSADRPGTTKQDQGAIARFIAARGPGLHHVALKVADIDRALTTLGSAGLTLIDRVGRPGSRRALIGFVHPKSFGGVVLHLVQRPVPTG